MFPENKISDGAVRHVISLSGGKDSLALWLLSREWDIDSVVIFADTGHEHPLTYEYISLLEQKLGPVIRVRADFSQRIINKRNYIQNIWPIKLVEKYGYTPQGAEQRVAETLEQMYPRGIPFLDLCIWKGRFPSTRARFCTFELKHRPIDEQIIQPLLGQYDDVVSWQGVRAQESASRARLPELELDADNQPGLHVYRPLLQWTHDDVFALAKRHGIPPNPLYQQGCSRVGCMPCIHARKKELGVIFRRFPEQIQRVAEWERIVAACSTRGNSTFFPSTRDPLKAEQDINKISLDSHGIETYRRWAFSLHGGKLFDEIAAINDSQPCYGIYTGICE
ncbi:phosphoadenosine phosphosulfate reductase family protein [Citrobacter freundii]|uniref:phosphoadenosine phosphosulfate reductase domain-containing protein n=1 Tax=Citrobacter freundii TaxID=546 RepID=UPI0015F85B65|nr:phosphoadenosine phosphosulfate reductase family protein [Citrobacter freundii]MBA7948068.1 phosphoadenosine phosphosulfate reductase family protein [Citrobacter freundii]MBJ9534862.1 phosphoadenosine phosphosulfate reductase family protein [Citrobacter freundii]